ncbi:MAG: 5-methyltetrahydropteroyltriglutamate--homocysteine S-methyltransferase, partial [Sphingobacteriaceae bacterium]
MLKNNLGYPRVGANRQLKKACEQYWSGKINSQELFRAARKISNENWQLQLEAGIDLIPCNDFSFYDQVLDMSLLLGVIPERYNPVVTQVQSNSELDLYFAMARGYQQNGLDITAMEMTKWFDTNYHYLVPEFKADQQFKIFSERIYAEFAAAKQAIGKTPKPVLLGPVSYLLCGKEKEEGFNRIDLIKKLVPVYVEIINNLENYGAEWIQLDEPYLAMDLSEAEKKAFEFAYQEISKKCKRAKILLTTYFDGLHDNASFTAQLPVAALHVDLVRAPNQLNELLPLIQKTNLILSLGVVDGRNIWKNDYLKSAEKINQAVIALGENRIMIAPSCSLLHTPFDLDLETEINPEIKNWMAFAKQKLHEVSDLYQIAHGNTELLKANTKAIESRRTSILIHKPEVKQRVAAIATEDDARKSAFTIRQEIQQKRFNLPLFPTTTIGSFPQTEDIRMLRLQLKKQEISQKQYDKAIEKATIDAVKWQEEIGLDVLVHGEFERND